MSIDEPGLSEALRRLHLSVVVTQLALAELARATQTSPRLTAFIASSGEQAIARSLFSTDFLLEDGGLTAVLGVVTVRIEAESIRALIAARLDQTDVPAEQRSKLKAALGTVSTEALKTVTKRLVEEALARAPNALPLLNTWLGSAG